MYQHPVETRVLAAIYIDMFHHNIMKNKRYARTPPGDGRNQGLFVIPSTPLRNGSWPSEVLDSALSDTLLCGSSFLAFVTNHLLMWCSYRWSGSGWMEATTVWRTLFSGACLSWIYFELFPSLFLQEISMQSLSQENILLKIRRYEMNNDLRW